jgi:hypothetical protein
MWHLKINAACEEIVAHRRSDGEVTECFASTGYQYAERRGITFTQYSTSLNS